MTRPCNLELRGLSGSEPCGACNRPARDHRGHREYVEPTDPEDGITAFAWSCLADGCCPNTCTTCHPVEPAAYMKIVESDPNRTTVTMSQEAYDAAIAGAIARGQRSGPYAAIVYALEDALGVHDLIPDDAKTWHKVASIDGIRAFVADYRRLYQARPLTKIASALSCDAGESECLDAIDSLRRELECSEDASSMERQRRKDAELTRDAAVDLASNRGEQVSRLTAELAKALEAAPARGFPSDLRRSVRAVVRGATFESASSVLTNINDWLTSQPADETAALRARVRELETERDAAYGRGIEEAFRVVCEEAPCIARVRDESGDWTDAIGRRETYLAIRALATRGAT